MNHITAKEAKEISDHIGKNVIESILYENMEEIYDEIRRAAKQHKKDTEFTVYGVTPNKKFLGISIPGTRDMISDNTVRMITEKIVELLKEDGFDAWTDNSMRSSSGISCMKININWIKAGT